MPRKYSRKSRRAKPNELLVAATFIAVAGAIVAPAYFSNNNLGLYAAILGAVVVTSGVIALAILYAKLQHKQRALRALELIDIDTMTGQAFEKYLAAIFKKQGYHVRETAATGDFGVDLVIKKDSISTAVQIKRYGKPVGIAAVQEAVAGKQYYKCSQAMVVTNTTLTPAAYKLAAAHDCTLIDREKLAEWVLDFH